MLALRLLTVALIVRSSHAAHGLDNNWTVKVTGMVDANMCVRITSVDSIEDMGTNIATGATSQCVPGTDTCEDGYSCDAARARKPGLFAGCTFDSSTASESSVTGVIMDGTCYDNFIVKQLAINGNPKTAGLAPDLVHVRSEAHLHTRACLVVNYCSGTGFYLLQSAGEDMGTNIATGATSRCVPGTDTCEDGYSCDAARARKPGSFSGCTFDSSTASESSVTGVLMDGTCYNNFIVKQLVVNGNPKTPGLAPDLVHVRSEAHLHTRACLVVNYCSASGLGCKLESRDPLDFRIRVCLFWRGVPGECFEITRRLPGKLDD
ncbi:unnamed protein product [Symbiodinium pilosum]|uniref:Uncharacterized protein n=1 Tax=Symbiodinium pilosum TaxID=2952 RepID=A0A812LDN0_SYMPI|nr:unnamed protein product [Symbiodinium pilosum]